MVLLTRLYSLCQLCCMLQANQFKNISTDIKNRGFTESHRKDNKALVSEEDDLAWPGDDEKKLEKIKELWQKYYDCLIEKHKSLIDKVRKPIMVPLLEGQYAELECSICQRPFQDYSQLQWKYKTSTPSENETELDHLDLLNQISLTKKMTLEIYNAKIGHSGLYVCFHGKEPVSAYILEVSNDLNMIEVSSQARNETSGSVTLSGSKMQVYVQWSRWTECSACDVVGKRFKYGHCMVSLIEPENPQNETIESNRSPRDTEKEILSTEEEIVGKFETGIPCNSTYLPKSIRQMNEVSKAVKVQVEYCKVECPGSVIFEVTDAHGKIVERANNSAGIYSALQELPNFLIEVERMTVVAEFGKNVVIQCPGNLKMDTPVTWKVKNLTMIPEIVQRESRGRITIDLINRLHINKLRRKDSHIYSCWQRNELAGTVNLEVEKKFKIGFDHHIILLSLLAITLTFLTVAVKILGRQRQMKKRTTSSD